LPREPESDFVHSGLVNRPGHDGLELAAAGECDRLLKRSRGHAIAGLVVLLARADSQQPNVPGISAYLETYPASSVRVEFGATRRPSDSSGWVK